MKLRFRKSALFSAPLVAGMLFSTQTQAGFVMMLDDPNDNLAAITIYDGSGNDQNGVNGVISYSGSVGAFNVNVTTGISKPTIGPGMLDLNSINVSGASGTLLVSISDTDYTDISAAYQASFSGITRGDVSLSFLLDNANQEFGGAAFAADSFNASPGNYAFANQLSGNVLAAAPFSLSILAQINHSDAAQVTSFDAEISPVPLPASAWLLGSALILLGRLRQRRQP